MDEIEKTFNEDLSRYVHADKKKLDNFHWNNDPEELIEDASVVNLNYNKDDVEICAKLIEEFILTHLDFKHLNLSSKSHIALTINVDNKLHMILDSRFNEEWALDSRLRAISDVGKILQKRFDNNFNRSRMNNIIRKIVPKSSRKEYVFSHISIIDDPMELEGLGTIEIEIIISEQLINM